MKSKDPFRFRTIESQRNSKSFNKVLIIDDNSTDRHILARNIDKNNFSHELIVVSSCEEALKSLSDLIRYGQSFPEIIFLDLVMPILDGFEFLETFELFPNVMTKCCKVFILSSFEYPEEKEKALSYKYVYGYYSKPFDENNLIDIASKHQAKRENTFFR